jgi:undecaprenyl-diphosphatase
MRLSLKLPAPSDLLLCVLAPVAAVMTAFAAFDLYLPGDLQISRAVQSLSFPGLQVISDTMYVTGIAPWLYVLGAIIAAGLFVLRHRLLAGFMFVALVAHHFFYLVKILIERPRPTPDLVDVAHISSGFSFPSGHVMSAVLLWGFVIFASQIIKDQMLRTAVQVFAVSMMALMGLQRIYAGAHWPTDVLAAYLWGIVVLLGVVKVFEFLRARDQRLSQVAASA